MPLVSIATDRRYKQSHASHLHEIVSFSNRHSDEAILCAAAARLHPAALASLAGRARGACLGRISTYRLRSRFEQLRLGCDCRAIPRGPPIRRFASLSRCSKRSGQCRLRRPFFTRFLCLGDQDTFQATPGNTSCAAQCQRLTRKWIPARSRSNSASQGRVHLWRVCSSKGLASVFTYAASCSIRDTW